MLNDNIIIGGKIDIRPINHEGKPMLKATPYASLLVNIEDEETLHIAAPIIQNKVALLHTDREYHLCFYTDMGLYQCNCIPINYYKDNKMVVIRVKLTSEPVKFQRRQFYRLECIHDVEYRMFSDEEEMAAQENDNVEQNDQKFDHIWLNGVIIDISGGGARLNSAFQHNKGDKIKIKLDLAIGNSLRNMELTAVVIATDKVANRNDRFEHRVQFYNISRKDRDDLIKYIFEQERLRRKNGKAD